MMNLLRHASMSPGALTALHNDPGVGVHVPVCLLVPLYGNTTTEWNGSTIEGNDDGVTVERLACDPDSTEFSGPGAVALHADLQRSLGMDASDLTVVRFSSLDG